MQGEDILQTVAEISIAFAGFTGVVVAFRRRLDRGDGSIQAHAFQGMLASSLQALLFSILPFLLLASGLEEPGLWRWASGLMLIGLVAGGFMDLSYARRADRAAFRRIDRFVVGVILLAGVCAMLAQLANVLGAISRPFAPYLGGLAFFLFFSSLTFVRLLTVPERERVGDS